MNYNILNIIIIFAIVIFSVILHELAHGAVAYLLGDNTAKDNGRLSLNPLKHIDPYMSILVPVILYILGMPVFGGAKPVPVNYRNLKGNEWGMALVALAGPLTNFLLALIFFLIGHFTGIFSGSAGTYVEFIFIQGVYTNLGFMLFNLIPIPPLDGSRILYAISPDFVREFLEKIEHYGVIVVYILILLFGNVFYSLIINGELGIIRFFYLLVGANMV